MKENVPKKILKEMDEEYLKIIEEIIDNKEFQKRKLYHHHENRSVYGHSLLVSIRSYNITKKLGLDYKAAAIGGLLHDFYFNDWQKNRKTGKITKAHGFVHAKEALENSRTNFPNLINRKTSNIILRHMFPLNFIPPLYLESWIVCLVDKYSSFEVFSKPKELYKYIGIRKKDGENNE